MRGAEHFAHGTGWVGQGRKSAGRDKVENPRSGVGVECVNQPIP